MLIIDRTQRTWATLSAAVCVVAGAVYFLYTHWSPNGPSGGSVPGLMFGTIAAGMMIFAGLLGARRRFPAARIGSAQFWLKGHLWIGTLTVPFALFHAGFGLGGRVEILLWVLFFAVVFSGFWGLLLQQILPRMMFANLPRETFIEQIPHLCNRFTAESDQMLSELCGPLEVTLTPVELKRFESHLRPHFEEDRKKNRNDYPKSASDAVHFQKFLTKVYVGIPALSVAKPAEDILPATPVVAAPVTAPVMKSVAQVKAPGPSIAEPQLTSGTALSTDAPAAKPKPDPRALLAAARAKQVPDSAATTNSDAHQSPAEKPAVTPVVSKPDPQALLAAARAKKAALAASAGTVEVDAAAVPVTPSKPDPRAMLAAARAKKVQAESVASPGVPAIEPPAPSPTSLQTGPVVAVPAAGAKPDPKAILAAAKAKREAAAAEVPPASVPAAGAKPDPKAMLAAAKAKREAAAAEVPPASVPVAGAKPDPKAMLAAAKAKREAAAADSVTPSATTMPLPSAGKPDPQAMLAAMKAKKAAAALQGTSADGTPATVVPAPVKPNPLAQLKAVKEPPAEAVPALVAAAKVAPPTQAQLAELKLFYLELIRPQLPLQPDTRSWQEAIGRSVMASRIRADNQHPQFVRIFDHLQDLCEQRHQFSLIQRYHRWLHGWLLIHIPATVALYLVLVVHAIVALRVIPFGN